MRNYYIIFLSSLLWMLTACENQTPTLSIEEEVNVPGILLNFTPLGNPNPMDSNDNSYEIHSGEAETQQETVENVVMLVFRPGSSGNNFIGREAISSDKFQMVNGCPKVYIKNFLLKRNDIIYILANLPDELLNKTETLRSESDMDNLYVFNSSSWQKNGKVLVPLMGKITWMERNETCSLKHAIARFCLKLGEKVFEGKNISYQITNYVQSGNFGIQSNFLSDWKYGIVAEGNSNKTTFNVDEQIYLFAYPHSRFAQGKGCNNKFDHNRAHILITVQDNQNYDIEYYRLDFHDPEKDTYLDVVPNGDYIFNITHVNSNGYATPEEAQENPGGNIQYEFCPNTYGSTSWDWVCQIYSSGSQALYTSLTSEYIMLEANRKYEEHTAFSFALATSAEVEISVSGDGLKLRSSKYPGNCTEKTDIIIDAKEDFTGGEIHIVTKNMQYDFPVYQKKAVDVDCHYETLSYENVRKARILDAGLTPWIELSKECSSNLSYNKTKMYPEVTLEATSGGTVYVHFDENLDMSNKGNPDPRKAIVLVEHYENGNFITTLYEYSQVSVKYAGVFGGMQDSYPYSRGLVIERIEEDGEQPWGFNSAVMGDLVIEYENIKKDDYLNIPIRKNGWAATKKLAENIATSGHPDGKYAARICYEKNRDIDGNGILTADEIKWYLPAFDQIWDTCRKLALSGYYWSTTESAANSAWVGRNYSGINNNSDRIKSESNHIRCVRDM